MIPVFNYYWLHLLTVLVDHTVVKISDEAAMAGSIEIPLRDTDEVNISVSNSQFYYF